MDLDNRDFGAEVSAVTEAGSMATNCLREPFGPHDGGVLASGLLLDSVLLVLTCCDQRNCATRKSNWRQAGNGSAGHEKLDVEERK